MRFSKGDNLQIRREEADQLNDAICKMQKPDEAGKFLRDLLTFKEHQELSRRLEIANMLQSGFTQAEISDVLGAGVSTVSRVNAKLKSGVGFKNVIQKLPKRKEKTSNLSQISNPLAWYIQWKKDYLK